MQSSAALSTIHPTLVPCPRGTWTHAEHSGHLKNHGDYMAFPEFFINYTVMLNGTCAVMMLELND